MEPGLTLVAAVARNGAIGRRDALPWRLPTDMKHFRQATMGKPVVMGRRTFLSIGKPLPGRLVVVASRAPGLSIAGVLVAPSLEAALAAARGDALRRGGHEIVVAGGADIYAQTIARAHRLLITEVDLSPDGDSHFPAIDVSVWRETAREGPHRGEGDDAAMSFVTYMRA